MLGYQQLEKNLVREKLLPHAVEILSIRREESTIVRVSELRSVVDWFVQQAEKYSLDMRIAESVNVEFNNWIEFHKQSTAIKMSNQLKVLYLCGPEPLNDLKVLIACGIDPKNVWALTSKVDFKQAVDQIKRTDIPLKIHCGSLAEFFEQFNESFDIIYVDACGPFCGGTPNTLSPIVNIFQMERLKSPGILITNFCQPPLDEGNARTKFIDCITAYYASRYNNLPHFAHKNGPDPAISSHLPQQLRTFVEHNLQDFYSEFVTHLIVDISMNLIPNWRALSMGSLSRMWLSQDAILKTIKQSNGKGNQSVLPGEFYLNPEGYPLVTFFRMLEEFQPLHPVLALLANLSLNGKTLKQTSEIGSMLNGIVEGHWEILSETFLDAIRASWFDYNARLTHDIPLPNLTVNSLLGIYGRPWFTNPRHSLRFRYRAKTNAMYCDLLVMDQCRSYFDWFPTLELLPSRFESVAFQIVARCILDRIGKHNQSFDSHPFRFATVTSETSQGFSGGYKFDDRIVIN